jgi:hypothetical protein
MDALARHQCLIYEGSPAKHLPGLATLMYGKLTDHYRCIYLNSPTMIAGARSYLYAAGVDVAHEVRTGALVLTSDQSQLVNGRFDTAKMLGMLVDAVDEALKDGYKGLFASGDMTWELGSEKNADVLLDYERGLEQLFRLHPALCGICQYHRDTLAAETIRTGLYTHQALYISETLSRMNPYYGSEEFMAHPGLELSARLDAMIRQLSSDTDRE